MKTFFESRFGYFPFIWMFHRRKVNSKINHLQERSLRIADNDYITSFEDLLRKETPLKFTIKTFNKVKKGTANPIL